MVWTTLYNNEDGAMFRRKKQGVGQGGCVVALIKEYSRFRAISSIPVEAKVNNRKIQKNLHFIRNSRSAKLCA